MTTFLTMKQYFRLGVVKNCNIAILAILHHIIGNPCEKVTKRSSHVILDQLVFDELNYEAQSLFFPKYSCFRCLGPKSSCKYTTISVINNVRVFFHLIFLKCCILLTLAQVTFKFSGLVLLSLGTISTNFCGKILKIADFVTIFPGHSFFTITRYVTVIIMCVTAYHHSSDGLSSCM